MTLTSLSSIDLAAVVIVAAAALAWVNARFMRLPQTVALTLMGLIGSVIAIAVDRLTPDAALAGTVKDFMGRIDFRTTLLDGMLSFLLFAGALHVSLTQVRKGLAPILTLATAGVLVSTVLAALGFKVIAKLAGVEAPMMWCLVFGALISPTDPVAVLGLLKRARIPPLLEATVGAESLFNDGVGVVVFIILLGAAASGAPLTADHAAVLFLVEAGGGALLGFGLGFLCLRAMRMIDAYDVEIMVSLALVMGGYSLAHHLGVSGPVAMAVAGLLVGNYGFERAMSDETRDYFLKFWTLLDEVFNAALFLLIGLEAVTLSSQLSLIAVSLLAIPLVLLARLVTTGLFIAPWRKRLPLTLSLPILTWGGLRGGLAIAMALALPAGAVKDLVLAVTYVVVMFSVIVQGLTMAPLVARLTREKQVAA